MFLVHRQHSSILDAGHSCNLSLSIPVRSSQAAKQHGTLVCIGVRLFGPMPVSAHVRDRSILCERIADYHTPDAILSFETLALDNCSLIDEVIPQSPLVSILTESVCLLAVSQALLQGDISDRLGFFEDGYHHPVVQGEAIAAPPPLPVLHNLQITTDVSFPDSNKRHCAITSLHSPTWVHGLVLLASFPIWDSLSSDDLHHSLGGYHRSFSSGNPGLGQPFTRKFWWEHFHISSGMLVDQHRLLTSCPGALYM